MWTPMAADMQERWHRVLLLYHRRRRKRGTAENHRKLRVGLPRG